MCDLDFFAFRDKARATFKTLNVSVGMEEAGTTRGTAVTIYKVSLTGMAIGADAIASQGANLDAVLRELIRRVAQARRTVRDAADAAQRTRRQGWVLPAAVGNVQARA